MPEGTTRLAEPVQPESNTGDTSGFAFVDTLKRYCTPFGPVTYDAANTGTVVFNTAPEVGATGWAIATGCANVNHNSACANCLYVYTPAFSAPWNFRSNPKFPAFAEPW